MKKIESEKKYIVRLTPCPLCQGIGYWDKKICKECHGASWVLWDRSRLHYWGNIIDEPHNIFDTLQKRVRNTVNGILHIFGLVGVLLLFIELSLKLPQSYNFIDFWKSTNFRMLIFWFSLVTDSYLFYRYTREFESLQSVPKKLFKENISGEKEIPWNQIKQLKGEQRIDISSLYTQPAMQCVRQSYEISKSYKHFKVTPLHLFISLLTQKDIVWVFIRLGIRFDDLKKRITNALMHYGTPTYHHLHFTEHYYKILFEAFYSSWYILHRKVESSDILLALVKHSFTVREILFDIGIDIDKIQNVTFWIQFQQQLSRGYKRFRSRAALRPKSTMNRSMTALASPYLDRLSQDLTALARDGFIEPCIGRQKEIEQIFRIIDGGAKRGVILVGSPGIGKRTIINGIAQLMISEDVPAVLNDMRLVSLSVARLTSGVSPAEASQRLLIILNEIVRSGNIALCINDISKMIGLTQGGPGSIDLAEVLSQTISKSNIIVFATSLPSDFTRYIENHSSLLQVLEKVNVNELSGNDAIRVLESKSGQIEFKHKVFFSYDAIAKDIELTDRYIHERYLPEKAIEILEETASRIYKIKGQDATITDQDIAHTVSEKTEIPLTQITQTESEKLLHLEDDIHKRIIDQQEAVYMVATAIRRARAEMRDIKRPIVNLLFLGPTGVGKTELAKTIIKVYFGGNPNEMIRLDMSEYQEKSSVNRLLGAPPGYEGSGGGGYLTEMVRKNPYSLVLLDEVEKAHPDILNIFLQVMDDGRLTDASGRTIDFTNIILIATSNACTSIIQKSLSQGVNVENLKNQLMEGDLLQYFRPELLNRFDGIIIFKPLSRENVKDIARIMLKEIEENLENKGIYFQITDNAVEELAYLGFDPKFGARPLRRVLQEKVSDIVANYILGGTIQRRDTIVLDVGGKVDIIKPQRL